MSNCSEILVLVADENHATLYANNDGVTRRLRQIERVSPMAVNADEFDGASSHVFACELMMALGRCVREQLYESVIIFAEAPMMEALREVQTGTVAKVLLAQIVGKITETCRFPGIVAANAPLAYQGGLQ